MYRSNGESISPYRNGAIPGQKSPNRPFSDKRKPLKIRQVENMMAVLIRHERAFSTARKQLEVKTFSEIHTGFAAIWSIVLDYFDNFGVLPDEEEVATELEAKAEDDPMFSDDELTLADEFLRYAHRMSDELIESHVQGAFHYLRRYLEDRLADEIRHNLGMNQMTPKEMGQQFLDLKERADKIHAIGSKRSILNAREVLKQYSEQSPPVIHGILRRGETANLIAPPKVGKSWMAMGLALQVASGRRWLNSFPTERGRVLIIDNELQLPTLSERLRSLADQMNLLNHKCLESVELYSLRGNLCDIFGLEGVLQELKSGKYSLVVLDALYRMLPDGGSENDNSLMAAVYNQIDRYAKETNAAWVAVHHSSKGNQADKAVTDVGAGGGAQARAVDAHIILREHKEPDAVVLDAAVRSFPRVEPVVLRRNFPLWSVATDLDPSELQSKSKSRQVSQNRADDEGCEKILNLLSEGPASQTGLCGLARMGSPRMKHLLARLLKDHKIQAQRITKKKGGPQTEYSLIKP